jgi:midasin (ATPase involved in ribosome maturation)
MQLHRDTTVAGLTQSASLEQGRLVWRDSPLVKAVEYGRVLVLDEADKASLEVREK